jgi:hypothetical protein
VDEIRGLQHLSRRLLGETTGGQSDQVVVDQWHDLVSGVRIAGRHGVHEEVSLDG